MNAAASRRGYPFYLFNLSSEFVQPTVQGRAIKQNHKPICEAFPKRAYFRTAFSTSQRNLTCLEGTII